MLSKCFQHKIISIPVTEEEGVMIPTIVITFAHVENHICHIQPFSLTLRQNTIVEPRGRSSNQLPRTAEGEDPNREKFMIVRAIPKTSVTTVWIDSATMWWPPSLRKGRRSPVWRKSTWKTPSIRFTPALTSRTSSPSTMRMMIFMNRTVTMYSRSSWPKSTRGWMNHSTLICSLFLWSW